MKKNFLLTLMAVVVFANTGVGVYAEAAQKGPDDLGDLHTIVQKGPDDLGDLHTIARKGPDDLGDLHKK
ncbi:MAG: hypothetical protein ACRCW2_02525 [Cellulosilyticaceae bacterium]